MSAATQFDPIFKGLSTEVGKMRIASSGMAWKGVETNEIKTVGAQDIKSAQWLRVARGFQLRIGLKDRQRETFDGFKREDLKKISELFKNNFHITVEEIDVSFKGWNWGVTDFRGQDLAFLVSGKMGFEVPLRNVANSNIAGRTEVSLEFSTGSSPPKSKHAGDEMTEIRFHVPGVSSKMKGSDDGSQKSDAEGDDDELTAAQAFHDSIKETADIGQVTGDIILSFEEVLVLTPRGRYDVDMFPDFLRLRGKTYDYKIIYSTISRLFLLPKDDQHVLFILGLNNPIRQGQTRYHYLVMQFTREEEITAELNMPEEEIAKYERLKKNYEDPTFEVVSSVFRALSKKKVIGSSTFQSRDGHPGIKVNLKAVQGDLFMLEKYIFFVSKQPVLIELSDIQQVVFSRVGQSTAARTFDLKIVTKSGPEYMFVSINKEELDPTETYLKEKKIRIKEIVPDVDVLAAVGLDDDDDDMQSVDSDEDKRPRIKSAKDDDEDSSEDEDFQASGSDSGSPSATDSDSDGAATASDASGDRDFTKTKKVKKTKDGDAPKKKKKKVAPQGGQSDAEDGAADKPKKKAKAKAKADDAMDVDDDKPKPKPKPKAKPKKDDDGGAMDVDEPPRPKPKPKKKADGAADEPPKKKLKKAED
ncbi:SSrecog-domain-containing protein [Mycena vulgaris]|nr:SSrecog-domain-containing protein [Mycena vulgaris]